MTLITGILCDNSIVMAADSAATFATTTGSPTIKQSVKKLEIVDNQIIMGVSGQVGTAQLFQDDLQNLVSSRKIINKPIAQTMSTIGDHFRNHVEKSLKLAASLGDARGAYCSTLVAMPISNKPTLIEFDQLCQPERKTDQIPFVSIGSGQYLADPFLALLRRVFWPKERPSFAQGLFATVWTLEHCTTVSPAFVAAPIQIAVLEKSGDTYKARELSDEELEEHKEACSDAEDYLSEYGKPKAEPIPQVPKPASE